MEEVLEIVGVALTAFVSTNTDNLVLLSMLLGQRGQRGLPVLSGYAAAMAALALLGIAVARLADELPDAALGYLGLIPLAMGLVRLRRALLPPSAAEAHAPGRALGFAGVAVLMLSNGSDTLGVLLPLFAETPEPLTYVIALTVVSASLFWFALARAIGRHPWVRARLVAVERWLVPILLIMVGLYILVDTPTDTLVE
jgi:cadmium resistance protein CadD (predicted permease)